MEIVMILLVAVIFFGPGRLPGLGKSIGQAIRGFKKGLKEIDEPETPSEQLDKTTQTEKDHHKPQS